MTTKIKYWSFISYSHRDKGWGDWLHKQLETFVLPKAVQSYNSDIGKNLYPIFRDREELPGSADLGANISQALKNSRTLLVICSPRSAKSLWVNQEIINYQELSPDQPVIALVVEGDMENTQSDNYCLPKAVKDLVENKSAELVDARQMGRCHALKLDLVSKILQVDLDELTLSVKKHRRIRKILATSLAMILTAGSWFAWNAIKQSQLDSLIAESERLSVIAEQALKSNDDSKALINALAAMPKNIESPEQPTNSRAAAVLNQLMSQPLLKIERGKVAGQIKGLRATSDKMLWLVTDTLGGIQLFDLRTGNARWTIEEPEHLISDINSQGQLIVRGKDALKNFDMASGQLNCEIQLQTHPHLGLDGSLGWMQKDWVMESEGHTIKGNPEKFTADTYTPRKVQFVNSKNCQASALATIGFSSHFNLVDVLPDGSKITINDSYIDGNPISGFQKWPDVDKPVPEYLFHLPEHTESFIAGYHNSQKYDGPLIKTSATKNISFIALQTNDKKGFVLTQFDWMSKKVVNRQMLPALPEKIYWQDERKNNILVLSQENQNSDTGSNTGYASKTPLMRVYKADDLSKINQTSGQRSYLANSLSPHLNYFASLDSMINIKQLKTQESFSRKRNQITQWNNLGWLDENRFVIAEQDGRIFTVDINQDITLEKIKADKCCYLGIDTSEGLVEASDGALYQIKTSQKNNAVDDVSSDFIEKLIYQPAHYETSYRYLSSNGLVFIDETLKDEFSNSSSEQQHSYKLMRLSDGKVLWEKVQQQPVVVNEEYLSYQEDDQVVIVNYQNAKSPLKLSIPENLLGYQYNRDASQLIGVSYTPEYLSDGESDNLLHVGRYDVVSNKRTEDFGFNLGSVLFTDKFFIFPEKELVAYVGAGDPGGDRTGTAAQKIHLKLLSLSDQKIQDLGPLPDSIAHSFSLSLEILGDYIKLVPSAIMGTADTLLINRNTKEQALFTNGEQIFIEQKLIEKDLVFLTNQKTQTLELLNLLDLSKQPLDCPYSREFNEVLPLNELGLLALRTESLCIVDPLSWKTLLVLDATTSSSTASYSRLQQLRALLYDSGNKLTALTGTNAAISVPLDFDWRKNIIKANELLSISQ